MCSVISAEKFSESFRNKWIDVKSIIQLTRIRETKDKNFKRKLRTGTDVRVTESTVYYISSRKLSAQKAIQHIKEHWSIENNLHWQLDVALGEDDWSVRSKMIALNLAAVRKVIYNILKN